MMEEQLEPYSPLCTRLSLTSGIPFTPNWSAAPDFLALIVERCLADRPEVVVECSSGLTTLMLARCCQMNGKGHVYSLEDGAEYAATTREYLARYGLESHATVIHAPLEKRRVNGVEYAWYSTAQLPDVDIDILVIDGPSGFLQENSRYPALPVLFARLSAQSVVFLDDAARPDEQAIAALWREAYPQLHFTYHDTLRGCSVFERHNSA